MRDCGRTLLCVEAVIKLLGSRIDAFGIKTSEYD